MLTSKSFACLTIFFALNIVTSTDAHLYSYITNTVAKATYAAAGYKPTQFTEKCEAEGDAILGGLNILYTNNAIVSGEKSSQVIVGTTGGNTCTYIYAEAKRLKNENLPDNQKPSKIIIVYTLNYVDYGNAAIEYNAFKVAVQTLKAAIQDIDIDLEVKQFRPVALSASTLIDQFDFQDFTTIKMNSANLAAQNKIIDDLHTQVIVDQEEIIGQHEFATLLVDENVKLIVDGIVGSGIRETKVDNQLLIAIPRAQIRIMASAILFIKGKGWNLYVLCNDNPSGMDETGKWTIHKMFYFPVDCIFSSVWNKQLVNSAHFLGKNPIVIVLDITYNNTRLFDALIQYVSPLAPTLIPILFTSIRIYKRQKANLEQQSSSSWTLLVKWRLLSNTLAWPPYPKLLPSPPTGVVNLMNK